MIENFVKDYSFYLFENGKFLTLFYSCFFFTFSNILFYVFNIKLKYLKEVRLIGPVIIFFYKKIFASVTFSFLIFKKKKLKQCF